MVIQLGRDVLLLSSQKEKFKMKKTIIHLIVVCSVLIPTSAFAEVVKIRSSDKTFLIHKETILQGPEGFLKALFSNEQKLAATKQKDGSYLVDVDSESMRVALGFIRRNRMDEIALKSALIALDIDFLFPGLDIKSVAKKTLWMCVAYCHHEVGKGYKTMTVQKQRGRRLPGKVWLMPAITAMVTALSSQPSMNGQCVILALQI